MARRRRSSLTGRIFREATRTLPGPVQFAIATPMRAFIALLLLGAAMSYGLIHVNFQNGRPSLTVDQKKAAELKEKGMDWVEEHEGELKDRIWGGDEQQPKMASGFTNPFSTQPFGNQPASNQPPVAPFRQPVNTATTPQRGRVGIRRD